MYNLRFITTWVCEFCFQWPTRDRICSVGHVPGSLGALAAWCTSMAHYSARWQHPLWVCIRRDRFKDFMEGDG